MLHWPASHTRHFIDHQTRSVTSRIIKMQSQLATGVVSCRKGVQPMNRENNLGYEVRCVECCAMWEHIDNSKALGIKNIVSINLRASLVCLIRMDNFWSICNQDPDRWLSQRIQDSSPIQNMFQFHCLAARSSACSNCAPSTNAICWSSDSER
jgi:hypothetical protein